MKIGSGLALTLFLLLCTGLAPSSARANPPAPIDCTQGCHVITCSGNTCALWKCDSRGCKLVASWERELSDDPLSTDSSPKAHKVESEFAYAKVCLAGRDCELYRLSVDEATHIGSFDNIDDVIREREPAPVNPSRQRR